jgi:pimeloyl-ACP methyl ester carboxylesterase
MKTSTLKSEDMNKINQKPVLYVRGSDSGHRSIARQEIVLKILIHTKVLVIDKTKLMIQIMNPEDLAEGLDDFFASHPMY